MPARHGRAALRGGGRAATSSTGHAASTRRSARTRRCSPIWCAGCSRTAPTRRSSTASPTRASPIAELVADPVEVARAIQPLGAPHARIAAPRGALWRRSDRNSRGSISPSDAELGRSRRRRCAQVAPPPVAQAAGAPAAAGEAVVEPRRPRRRRRRVVFAGPAAIEAALACARGRAPSPGPRRRPSERAAILRRAADAFEADA